MSILTAFFGDLRFHIDDSNLAVRAEQLRVRLRFYPPMLAGQLTGEAGFVWLMWETAPHGQLLLWLGMAYALHLLDYLTWKTTRDAILTLPQCRKWSRHIFSFALVTGMMWGIGTLFFFPTELLMQVLLVCVLLALTAIAAIINSMHFPALYAYVLTLMLPLSFRVMVEWDASHFALAALLLLFLFLMLSAGHLLGKFIALSLRQRFENEQLAKRLANINDELEHKVEERTEQLQRKTEEVSQIRDVTIMAMASLAETRDNETGNHLKRTQRYVRTLAMALRNHPRFRAFLTDDNIESLYKLAPLHDIGKVGIPDAILRKPGKLTPEEFEIMKTHTLLGGAAIAAAESSLPTPNRFLYIAREIATFHHEKWDGSGYPQGLKGDAIPISARLMAVADVYDALICKRIYKEAYTHEDAVAYILRGSGQHFDPDVIEAFRSIQEEFRQIAETYRD